MQRDSTTSEQILEWHFIVSQEQNTLAGGFSHQNLIRVLTGNHWFTLGLQRDSTTSETDSGTTLPRVLYAFQLRASALPPAMRQLLSIFSIFAPAAPVPVAAVLHIFSQVHKRSIDESAVLLRGLSNACYVEIQAPFGRLMSGMSRYLSLMAC